MPDPDTYEIFDTVDATIYEAAVNDRRSANQNAVGVIESRYRAAKDAYLAENPVIGRNQIEREKVADEILGEAEAAGAAAAGTVSIRITP